MFDPYTSSLFVCKQGYFYVFFVFVCGTFFSGYWLGSSSVMVGVNQIASALLPSWVETKAVSLKGSLGIFISIFFIIFSFNVVGLLPYAFAYTSHIFFAMSLAVPLWLSTVISSFSLNAKVASASLVPYGVPQELGSFFAILETLSVAIRPLSLSLRLVVNITAGHCLFSFISQFVVAMSFSFPIGVLGIFFIHMGYLVLEVGVALVQAYIFTSLLSLYCDEHVS